MNCCQLLFHLMYLIWEKQSVRMALHRNLFQGDIGGDLRISFNSVLTAQSNCWEEWKRRKKLRANSPSWLLIIYSSMRISFFLIFAGMIYNWWNLHTRCAWNNEAWPRAGVASLSSFLHFLSALEREKLFKWFGILTLVTGEQTPNKKKNYSHITRKSLLATTTSSHWPRVSSVGEAAPRDIDRSGRDGKTKAVCHPLIRAWTSG